MPPKSILKKTTTPSNTLGSKPVDPRHLQIALHHANILEDRKRVEAEVLEAVMTLMDYPTSPDADPKHPSASDAAFFCKAMMPFQPADYDSLIEERNITGKCGYAMCPRPKMRARSTAKKHFVDTEHGVEIVDRKMLEVWCSEDCAKRALYVKVQLHEEPAWMRQGGYANKIELMIEDAREQHKALPLRLKQENVKSKPDHDDTSECAEAWAAREDAIADLALERGEKSDQPSKADKNLFVGQILERNVTETPPQPPSKSMSAGENITMAIEGHVPKSDRKDERSDDEADPQYWDKHLS